MAGIDVFKHLLPRGRAWSITATKNLRALFQGLADGMADAQAFIDGVFGDIDPKTTRQLDLWDNQFALPLSFLTDAQRRVRLDGVWKATGGQSPQYLQDVLQAAGFEVFTYDWWEPIGGRPGGGSVSNDVTPTAINPFTYLNNGTMAAYPMCDGAATALEKGVEAFDGNTNVLPGYALVNRIWADHTGVGLKVYTIPLDTTKYPFFMYIGGATFPNTAAVPESRRTEFETLCLKYCPRHLWLGMLITYV